MSESTEKHDGTSAAGGVEDMESMKNVASTEPKTKTQHAILEWVAILLGAIVFSVIIRSFVVDVYIIPTESMTNTILPGDRVFGDKVSYHFRSPERGEVVTFKNPLDESVTFVKRCIAVAGDEVDVRDGRLYVNGEFQEEDYVLGRPSYPLIEAEGVEHIEYPYVIPEGMIWVMGDNRTNSNDSRYFGPISVENVSSRGMCVFWPIDHAHGL